MYLNSRLGSSLALALRNTNGLASPTCGLSVLPTDTEVVVMADTTVSTNSLETFKIFAKFGIQAIGQKLTVLAVMEVALPVQEPVGNLVLRWVLHDGDDAFKFLSRDFTSTTRKLVRKKIVEEDTEIFTLAYRLLRSTSAFLQTRLE